MTRSDDRYTDPDDYRVTEQAEREAEVKTMAEHEAGVHDYNESMYADRCAVCRNAGAGDSSSEE